MAWKGLGEPLVVMNPLDNLLTEHPQFHDGPDGVRMSVRLGKATEPRKLRPFRPEEFEVV